MHAKARIIICKIADIINFTRWGRFFSRGITVQKGSRVVPKSGANTIFIGTAAAAQAAGFDGVELHAAHGYLLCEFLSPAFNKRDDQYGRSVENRCRIITELIQGIKAVCGPNFPVGVRFSCDEHDPVHPEALKLEDGVAIAKVLEASGADLLDVSNGNYFVAYSENEEPYSYAQGCRAPETKAIKDAVSIPVVGVSNIKQPKVAEQLLEDNVCDFVGLGRASIADPEWVRKAHAGCDDCIHHCIGCLYCFESLLSVGYVRCSVNPRAGRENIRTKAISNAHTNLLFFMILPFLSAVNTICIYYFLIIAYYSSCTCRNSCQIEDKIVFRIISPDAGYFVSINEKENKT